jgi:hypothetical protein
MIARCLLLSLLIAVYGATLAAAEDDSDVEIYWRGTDKVKWVWAAKRSRLAALPEWDPAKGDPPVTPYKAILAARELLRNQLGVYAPRLDIVSLSRIGAEWTPPGRSIWAYTIVFDSEKPSEDDQVVLQVLVLMDGKVVVPTKQRVKEGSSNHTMQPTASPRTASLLHD